MCGERWRSVGLFIHRAPEVRVMAAQRRLGQRETTCFPMQAWERKCTDLLMEEAYADRDDPVF